jgi:prepilin-type N-terminal cleavage/methylation domain-containing protein
MVNYFTVVKGRADNSGNLGKPRLLPLGAPCCGVNRPRVAPALPPATAGFTLIELMVAIGIMAVFMTIGMPTLFRNMHQDSMRKAVSDVMEACSTARARAILDNTTMELRIRPADRVFSVGPARPVAPVGPGMDLEASMPHSVQSEWGSRLSEPPAPSSPSTFSVTLSPSFIVEGLGVNGEDWTEDAEARVRFYPNGTSDSMSVILLSDKGERRNIWVEVVTGVADVEVDPMKFRAR